MQATVGDKLHIRGRNVGTADRYGEVIDMVECRNAAQLADFVTTL